MANAKRIVLVILLLAIVAAPTVYITRRLRRANNPLEAGQCTWYAVERAHELGWPIKFDQPYGRHAKFWPERVVGAKLSLTPAAGSIMVLDAWPGNPYGHVAYVENVADKDHWTVTHANMNAGTECRTLDEKTIREAKVARNGSDISFEGRRERFRLIGFLKKRAE